MKAITTTYQTRDSLIELGFLALTTASISVLGYEHETRVSKEWNEPSDLVRQSDS